MVSAEEREPLSLVGFDLADLENDLRELCDLWLFCGRQPRQPRNVLLRDVRLAEEPSDLILKLPLTPLLFRKTGAVLADVDAM